MDDSRFSLFIPTKDRSAFLSRLLKFYADQRLNCPIYIGDASEQPEEIERNRNAIKRHENHLKLDYEQHPAGVTTITGVHRLLDKIRTPYAVFGGDDDFLISKQLDRCARFLREHPDYTSITGDQVEAFIDWNAEKTGMRILKTVPGAHKEAADSRPSRRLLQWAYPAIGKNTFSVQPVTAMRWAWLETDRLGLNEKLYAPLHELSVNVLTVIAGKQKHLRGLYHVMLRHTQKTGFSGPIDYFDRIARWDWPSKVVPTLELWTREILARERIDPEPARRVAQTVFLQWLIPFLSRNRDRKLKEFLLPAAGRPLLRRLIHRRGFSQKSIHRLLNNAMTAED